MTIPHSAFLTPHLSQWLHIYTRLLVVATFLLVLAGGLVTSTGSGLAVPDWPLSYGQWMPPMVGGIFYEHLHRIIGAVVGLMTLILALWLLFSEKRTWLRWLGICALAMVVVQGILGGMTVLYLLPAPVSILHGCLAQTFFALVVCLSFFTSREWVCLPPSLPPPRLVAGGGNRWGVRLLIMTTALIYAQLILGAATRHMDNQLVVISHMVGAILVLIHVVGVLILVFRSSDREIALLHYPALFLGIVFTLQFALGIGAFVYTAVLHETIQPTAGKIFFLTGHQTLGALLLAASAYLALRVYRNSVLT